MRAESSTFSCAKGALFASGATAQSDEEDLNENRRRKNDNEQEREDEEAPNRDVAMKAN